MFFFSVETKCNMRHMHEQTGHKIITEFDPFYQFVVYLNVSDWTEFCENNMDVAYA